MDMQVANKRFAKGEFYSTWEYTGFTRHSSLQEIDAEIEKHIKDFEKEIELLQTIPGVGKEGAIGIVAEIGVDMDVFPSEHHLASHSGMCPGNNESAGKKKVQEHDKETNIWKQPLQNWHGAPLAQRKVFIKPNTKVWSYAVERNGH